MGFSCRLSLLSERQSHEWIEQVLWPTQTRLHGCLPTCSPRAYSFRQTNQQLLNLPRGLSRCSVEKVPLSQEKIGVYAMIKQKIGGNCPSLGKIRQYELAAAKELYLQKLHLLREMRLKLRIKGMSTGNVYWAVKIMFDSMLKKSSRVHNRYWHKRGRHHIIMMDGALHNRKKIFYTDFRENWPRYCRNKPKPVFCEMTKKWTCNLRYNIFL